LLLNCYNLVNTGMKLLNIRIKKEADQLISLPANERIKVNYDIR